MKSEKIAPSGHNVRQNPLETTTANISTPNKMDTRIKKLKPKPDETPMNAQGIVDSSVPDGQKLREMKKGQP